MLYAFSLYSDVYQLFFSKTGGKAKNMQQRMYMIYET